MQENAVVAGKEDVKELRRQGRGQENPVVAVKEDRKELGRQGKGQ